jgi:hypothetical protein
MPRERPWVCLACHPPVPFRPEEIEVREPATAPSSAGRLSWRNGGWRREGED